MIYIGIDPAFRKDGFCMAMLDSETNEIEYKQFKNGFIDFYQWFLNESPEEAVVAIENSNLQNTTFDTKGNKVVVARKSRDAGKNQAISQITVDICKTKYTVIDVSPKRKGRKWNDVAYNNVMRSEGITVPRTSNQDKRDSAKLVLIAKRGY